MIDGCQLCYWLMRTCSFHADTVKENIVSAKSDGGKYICHSELLAECDNPATFWNDAMINKVVDGLRTADNRVRTLERLVSDVTTELSVRLDAAQSRCERYKAALTEILNGIGSNPDAEEMRDVARAALQETENK